MGVKQKFKRKYFLGWDEATKADEIVEKTVCRTTKSHGSINSFSQ
jgi:hypothetical protein